ncbi:transcription antitermination regulator [Amycolatopsis thailandensis]|uniref:Transcription antitermination regulator n=1 Tax=Amycolatopsis thailandensis TaxID=589330 RepID=A0A229RBF7_9PSEU|nr:ANTAR domain-containing protein [Amycolatopsis thailandensis]OXM44013.1 transcription antitermination regulator [Amycolatopsis thailandensis]
MVTEREARIADAVLDLSHRAGNPDASDLLEDLAAHLHALLHVQDVAITQWDRHGGAGRTIATGELGHELVHAQVELTEGPCWDSARSREAIGPVRFGPGDRRWPRFGRYVRAAGITAVTTVPIRTHGEETSVLILVNTRDPVLSGLELRLARIFSDAAIACVAQRHSTHGLRQTVDQLQGALNSRVVIEQAKGVLSERFGVSVGEAFRRLHAHARQRRLKLRDLASDVASGGGPREFNP